MNEVIDASRVNLNNCKILFDTNIWILIQGFGYQPRPYKTGIYSAAYKELLSRNNKIVVNDYVIAEFCNRCAKLEYEAQKEIADLNVPFPRYKTYRESREFRSTMESVRDTCLNIIDDCEYIPASASRVEVGKALEHFCTGKLDFQDFILGAFCRDNNLYLMTDDHDFLGQNVKLITANNTILRLARR